MILVLSWLRLGLGSQGLWELHIELLMLPQQCGLASCLGMCWHAAVNSRAESILQLNLTQSIPDPTHYFEQHLLNFAIVHCMMTIFSRASGCFLFFLRLIPGIVSQPELLCSFLHYWQAGKEDLDTSDFATVLETWKHLHVFSSLVAVWGMRVGNNSPLAWILILGSSTWMDLKKNSNFTVFTQLIQEFWGRQNLYNLLVRKFQPMQIIWQSLPTAIPGDNLGFWMKNQWPSYWAELGHSFQVVRLREHEQGASCLWQSLWAGTCLLEGKVLPSLHWLATLTFKV